MVLECHAWHVMFLNSFVCGEKERAAAYVNFDDLPQTSKTEVLMEFLKRVSKSSNGRYFIYSA